MGNIVSSHVCAGLLASEKSWNGNGDSCCSSSCVCPNPAPESGAPVYHAGVNCDDPYTYCRCGSFCSAQGLVQVKISTCKLVRDSEGFMVCSCIVPKQCECPDGGVSDNGEQIYHIGLVEPIVKCSECKGMRNAKSEWTKEVQDRCKARTKIGKKVCCLVLGKRVRRVWQP
jgi:hypothetical protein